MKCSNIYYVNAKVGKERVKDFYPDKIIPQWKDAIKEVQDS